MSRYRLSPGSLFMLLVLVSAIYIIVTDAGHASRNSAGAGDIWWAQIPQIQEAYDRLTNQ